MASSPSRRGSSPFKSRLSRAGSRASSSQSLAALSSTSRRARAEPSSPTSSLGRAAANSPVSSQDGGLDGRGFYRSPSPTMTPSLEQKSPYATGLKIFYSLCSSCDCHTACYISRPCGDAYYILLFEKTRVALHLLSLL